MINQGVNKRAAGFLVLILTLLIMNSLESVLAPPPRVQEMDCPDPFFVQIAGEIPSPGVYPFCKRPRLPDLLRRAGVSHAGNSLPESLKNTKLWSGARVLIVEELAQLRVFVGDMSAFYKLTLGISISLNTESEDGLMALPGIGPRLAGAIVRERSRRGGFENLDDLTSINGIGPKLLKKIKPYLKI